MHTKEHKLTNAQFPDNHCFDLFFKFSAQDEVRSQDKTLNYKQEKHKHYNAIKNELKHRSKYILDHESLLTEEKISYCTVIIFVISDFSAIYLVRVLFLISKIVLLSADE